MSIDKVNSGANTIAGNITARKAPQKSPKKAASQPKEKFEPWIPKPKIHGPRDYFKNIGASVGNGIFGFGIMAAGTAITVTGADGKPKSKVGSFIKSALIVTCGIAGGVAGAGIGLATGIFGRNAGELINAKHMRK